VPTAVDTVAGVDEFSPAPRDAVRRLVDGARTAFGDGLISVLVHGSLAWGCWGPSSDIDVLLVVEPGTPLREFHEQLVAADADAPGNGFELSVLSREAAASGTHPVEYRYHFSRGRLARQSPGLWDLSAVQRDPDLAGHLLVAWTAGVCAFGSPARRVLRRVTDEEFLASVGADVLESCAEILALPPGRVPIPVYAVLNGARTLAWLSERAVLSKRAGGRWLIDHDPSRAELLTAALDEYADPRGRPVRTVDLQDLARIVHERVTMAGGPGQQRLNG
jgi:predicted nucleotidyltransferase